MEQDHLGRERIVELEKAVAEHSKAWRTQFPDRVKQGSVVFLKLHRLEHHIVVFARLNGMLGRCDEQGFENCHPPLNDVYNAAKSIMSSKVRVNCYARRLNARYTPGVQKVIQKVEDKIPRRPNRQKGERSGRRSRLHEEGPEDIKMVLEKDDQGMVSLSEHAIIPESWLSLYLLMSENKAPNDWVKFILEDEELGEVGNAAKLKLETC